MESIGLLLVILWQILWAVVFLSDKIVIPKFFPVKKLGSLNPTERAKAFNLLVKRGSRSVVSLIKALQHKKPIVRGKAAEALGLIKDHSAVESLIKVVKDQDANVRRQAVVALGNIGDAQPVNALIQALKDEESIVRQEAAIALGKIDDSRSIEPLMEARHDPDWKVQIAAKETLALLGVSLPTSNTLLPGTQKDSTKSKPVSTDEWILDLQDQDWSVRWKAVEALGKIPEDRVILPLIQALGDQDWSVRLKVVGVLGKTQDARVVQPLADALKDEHQEVRQAATHQIVKFGTLAIDVVLPLLADHNPEVRKNAAKVLGHVPDSRVVEALVKVLSDQSLDVRKTASDGLKKIGAPAVDYLVKALESKDGDVQWRAVDALGAIGDARAVKALVQILGDDDADVRLRAVEVLDNLGWKPTTDQERLAYLIAAQQWKNVVAIGAPAVSILLKFRQEKEIIVREQINQILTQICAVVETVVFGEDDIPDLHWQTTLRNLDAAELSISLSALKTIMVQTNSYDFHLVERFITYAINFIGQVYLKEHVEVHIYGNLEKLHPNLRNSLMNLCKQVDVHVL